MATSRNRVKPIHVIQVREFASENNSSDQHQPVEAPTTTGKINVFQNTGLSDRKLSIANGCRMKRCPCDPLFAKPKCI